MTRGGREVRVDAVALGRGVRPGRPRRRGGRHDRGARLGDRGHAYPRDREKRSGRRDHRPFVRERLDSEQCAATPPRHHRGRRGGPRATSMRSSTAARIARLREAFIAAGPEMLEYLEARTDVRFQMYRHHPDYRQELPGAAEGGRPLEPLPFDGRTLGKAFDRVRWPIPELMLFGGMMVTRGEAARLLRIARSWDAFRLGARLSARYVRDRRRYPRGTRLVLGNALAARLFKNLLDRRVAIWFNGRTARLISEDGRACGLVVERDGSEVRVRAARGIVLAGGGFPASPELRERYLPKPVAAVHGRVRGVRGRDAAAGPGDRRLARPAGRGQRAVVSELDRDPQGRVDGGVPAHRPGPREAGSGGRQFGGTAVRRRSGVVPRVHARDVSLAPERPEHPHHAGLRPAVPLEVRARDDQTSDAQIEAVRRQRLPPRRGLGGGPGAQDRRGRRGPGRDDQGAQRVCPDRRGRRLRQGEQRVRPRRTAIPSTRRTRVSGR